MIRSMENPQSLLGNSMKQLFFHTFLAYFGSIATLWPQKARGTGDSTVAAMMRGEAWLTKADSLQASKHRYLT